MTQSRSFQRQSSQPITWLILTNKTVQENTQTKYNPEKQTTENTAKQIYPGSVTSYDTRPGNDMVLFYKAPKPTRGNQQSHGHQACRVTFYQRHKVWRPQKVN